MFAVPIHTSGNPAFLTSTPRQYWYHLNCKGSCGFTLQRGRAPLDLPLINTPSDILLTVCLHLHPQEL